MLTQVLHQNQTKSTISTSLSPMPYFNLWKPMVPWPNYILIDTIWFQLDSNLILIVLSLKGVGAWGIRRGGYAPCAFDTYLASWYCSLQQVSFSCSFLCLCLCPCLCLCIYLFNVLSICLQHTFDCLILFFTTIKLFTWMFMMFSFTRSKLFVLMFMSSSILRFKNQML